MMNRLLLCGSVAACVSAFVSLGACGGSGSSHDLSTNEDLAHGQADLSGNVDDGTQPDLTDVTAADGAVPPDATMLPLPAGWNFLDDGGRSANVEGIVIHPLNHNLIFVATFTGGVFKSTDGGAHFSHSNVGLLTRVLSCIAVDPKNQSNVYVGTDSDGVFKSVDGGATWAQLGTGLSARYAQSVVVDSSGNVWAGLLGGDGVDELPMGTTTWVNKGSGLPSVNVPAVAIDAGGVLWAATTGGVAKLNATTSTWSTFNTGLPVVNVFSLALDPSNANIAYAGLTNNTFYKTTNGGTTWVAAGTGLTALPHTIVIDPTTPSTIYAGQITNVWVSTDSGATFTATAGTGISAGGNGIRALAIDPTSTSTLFAGTLGFGTGLYKTSNSGTTWLPDDTGLTNLVTNSIAIDPKDASNLYVATAQGVLASVNGGSSFAATGLTYSTAVVVVDPFDSTKVYAATQSNVSSSINSGKTWSAAATSPGGQVSALIADPVNTGVLYAGVYGGVWRTADNAATWTQLTTGLPTNPYVLGVALDPAHPTTVYATLFQAGTYRSTTSGSSWTQVDPSNSQSAAAIVVGGVTLVGTSNNNSGSFVRRATDGVTFSSVSVTTKTTDILCFTVDASGTIYAGTYGQGVYRSTDKGLTWAVANRGLDSFVVAGLADATLDGKDTLFAATGDGIYFTQTGGL